MAEWSIATVLKTVVLKGTGGSNPSLSAILNTGGDRIKMWDTNLSKKKKDPQEGDL